MAKSRILIVDDDPQASVLMQTVLQNTGLYTTVVQNRPDHALSTAVVLKPDLVLLADADTQEKRGEDLAREMRAHPAMVRTPVLFLPTLIVKEGPGKRELRGELAGVLSGAPGPRALLDAIGQALAAATIPDLHLNSGW